MRTLLLFAFLLVSGLSVTAQTCDSSLQHAYLTCGYDNYPTNNNTVVNTQKGCSYSCCTALNAAQADCNSTSDERTSISGLVSGHEYWQTTGCNAFVCGEPEQCLDTSAPFLGYDTFPLNRAYLACGVNNSLTDIDVTKACSLDCCGNMTLAYASCNSSLEYQSFDVLLTAFQIWRCPTRFTCIPSDECYDAVSVVSGNGGFLNRALDVCGVPEDVTSISVGFDPSTVNMNLTKTCSPTCCEALENAKPFCNGSSTYDVVSSIFPVYQATACTNFTCAPTECIDPLGLLNSRLGALNKVLKYCGAPSTSIPDILAGGNFDPTLTCLPRCCEEIEAARNFCSGETTFDAVLEAIYVYQAATCHPTFLCIPNDKCFDPLGLINPDIGAVNRALDACGAPASVASVHDLVSQQVSFNATKACSPQCCDKLREAEPFCNTTDTGVYQSFDVALTAYQLLACSDGFTCYPNDKCFDPQGLVNSNRGALSRTFAACGLPADIQDITVGFSNIAVDLQKACNITCCEAVENARAFCNSSDSLFTSFTNVLPAYQALKCENFTCNPEICFDPVGLLNSQIGAANRVLRYCGAPSDITSLGNIIADKFDPHVACQPRCCQEIELATPICNGSSDFELLVTALTFYQAGICRNPSFACVANDKCFDTLGLVNPDFGAINRALDKCGAPASIQAIGDLINSRVEFNASKACSTECCAEMASAKSYCNSTASDSNGYTALDTALTAYQLLQCSEGYTCYPNDQCFDPQGLVNSYRGAVNRAFKSCGLPADVRSITDGFANQFANIAVELDLACNITCCDGIDNAKAFCNSSNSVLSTFETVLPTYQAAKCSDGFTCSPTKCFDVNGFINSRIGAANRVMRFCGAVSDAASLGQFVAGNFNSSLACTPRCCEEIEVARPYCNTTADDESQFESFLGAIYAYQAAQCRPTFLCRPNDQCFDSLGLINPDIGAVNHALDECGALTSIRSISDAITHVNTLNGSKACSAECCFAFSVARSVCNQTSVSLTDLQNALYAYQAATCDGGFLCRTEVLCYDAVLGAINSEVAPLNHAMKVCGATTDLRSLSVPVFTSPDTSLMCDSSCCEAMADAFPTCRDSTLFANYEQALVTAQGLFCQSTCNVTAPAENVFSLCCGLGFVSSVGIVTAIVFVCIVIVVVGIVVLCVHFGKNAKPHY